jgi:hypothetical protein
MTVLSDYIDTMKSLVPGNLPLGDAAMQIAVRLALAEHGKHKPRVVVEDADGDGGFDYALTGLAEWSAGFSHVRQVEYPVDDDDATADILDAADWEIYEKPAGKQLRFLEDKPTATESFRVTYTAPHACTDSACTVSAADNDAVMTLAAGEFCEMLATHFAQSGDSTIQADTVDHKSRAAEYAGRARAYKAMYRNHMGVQDGKPAPASGTADWDVTYPGGMDRLTKPGRHR